MKKFFILLLLMPLYSFAQVNEGLPEENLDPIPTDYQEGHNNISQSTYNNIKINGVSLRNTQNFQGDVTAMEMLFGMPFSAEIPDPEAIAFINNNIKLVYGDATDDWTLYHFQILNSVIPLEILGKTVRLGDEISILGLGTNLKSLPIDGGKRSAVFNTDYDASFVAIHFDPITKKITKIEYVSPT